jgi:hypothetical protein
MLYTVYFEQLNNLMIAQKIIADIICRKGCSFWFAEKWLQFIEISHNVIDSF